jgi:ABC-type multidrug transport system fused ATPase/permease subunit
MSSIKLAKFITIISFLVLLFSTYFLRSKVLELNTIRMSSQNVMAEETEKNLNNSLPQRTKEYENKLKQYEIQKKHYDEMLDLYQSDYEEYVKRIKDKFVPPRMPPNPVKPLSPEISDEMQKISIEFRKKQSHYFESTSKMNWVSCVAALTLVGGLLYLLLFDLQGKRLFYMVLLVLSFIFMIGPSFHSLMSALAGFLQAPQGMPMMRPPGF